MRLRNQSDPSSDAGTRIVDAPRSGKLASYAGQPLKFHAKFIYVDRIIACPAFMFRDHKWITRLTVLTVEIPILFPCALNIVEQRLAVWRQPHFYPPLKFTDLNLGIPSTDIG